MSDYALGIKGVGTIEKNGVIVDSIPSGEVACIIFSSHLDCLFLVPHRIFTQIDPELLKNMSKNQRQKMMQNFMIGDNVDFEAKTNGLVTWIRKSTRIRELSLSIDGKSVFNMIGVISNEVTRRVWTTNFGVVNANEELLVDIMPNVPFNCFVAIELDYGRHEGCMQFDLTTFRPTFTLSLHSFGEVSLDYDLLYNAPWNTGKNFYPDKKEPEHFSEYIEKSSKNGGGKKIFKNVHCVAVSNFELFSPDFPRKRIKVARRRNETDDFVVGSKVIADLYFCYFNECFVAYDYVVGEDTLRVKQDDYWQNKFFTELLYDSETKAYKNELFGAVADSFKLMPLQKSAVHPVGAWVAGQYEEDGKYLKFVVVHMHNRKAPINKLKQPEGEDPDAASLSSPEIGDSTEEIQSTTNGGDSKMRPLSAMSRIIINEIGNLPQTYRILRECGLLDEFLALNYSKAL